MDGDWDGKLDGGGMVLGRMSLMVVCLGIWRVVWSAIGSVVVMVIWMVSWMVIGIVMFDGDRDGGLDDDWVCARVRVCVCV